MRARNLTRKTVLADKLRVARSFWARFRGLMLVPGLPAGGGLLIERCNSIHTHFMRFAIDAVFLSAEGRVVAVSEAMPPWRIGRFQRGACRVLELPAGTARASATQVGDQVIFENEKAESV